MSDGLSALKEEDIQKLVRLIESLDSSTFDYLQLKVGDVQVTLGKGAMPMSTGLVSAPASMAPASAAAPAITAQAAPSYAAASSPASAPAAPPSVVVAPSDPRPPTPSKRPAPSTAAAGTIDIKAQIMGMYYAQPEPGSPAFVSVGAEVKEDTTLCLIEVMKTFNAMTAGVKGVITEICAENAQLVEYGQVLFRVRPS